MVINRAVARALTGGGGCIFIYSCSARLISFEMNLKTTDFKRNRSGITRIYEYTPPPPPINVLATALVIKINLLDAVNLSLRIHIVDAHCGKLPTRKGCLCLFSAKRAVLSCGMHNCNDFNIVP